MKSVIGAALLSVCTALAAHAECRGEFVRLHVDRSGRASWNDQAFKDTQQMIDRFRQEARAKQQPKILFLPDVGVEPAVGMAILAEAQKAGLECVEFAGFEHKR